MLQSKALAHAAKGLEATVSRPRRRPLATHEFQQGKTHPKVPKLFEF